MAKRRLGRGLDALMGGERSLEPSTAAPTAIPLADIQQNPFQPRRRFAEGPLQELAQSIRVQGLMQPVIVRPKGTDGYELIAGERRLRAAGLAGLDAVPAIVREASDEQALALALIENIQREDLGPLEEAEALQRLRDDFGLTQQATADAVGRSREAVANLLRLLNLHPAVRRLLDDGQLDMGHARALLALPSAAQPPAAAQAVAGKLTVRQTEALVRRLLAQQRAAQRPSQQNAGQQDADTEALARELSERLAAPVSIRHTAKGAGRVTIRYASLDELDGILSRLR